MNRIVTMLAFAGWLAAGSGGARADAVTATPSNAPVPITDAYASGAVEVSVYVVPGYGDGRKLRVALKSRTGAPLRVRIPAGAITLDVGEPIPTLYLNSAAARTLALTPAKYADPLDLEQTGILRALDGTFRLYVDDGKPQFRGQATTGRVAP